ncbi:MAG: hypothetical protein M3011_05090 [Actinomycetota bacterium]|nr:hypothetical protein [Actinomycetota bacterium]
MTLPTRTMRAISSVSASVTRSPSRNSATLPRRAMRAPIWGPPPWTTRGRMPTERMSTMSPAKLSRDRSVPGVSGIVVGRRETSGAMTLPPYLTTMT